MLKWKKGPNNKEERKIMDSKEDEYWMRLETFEQRKSRNRSLYIVHVAMFVFSLGFSIVLTGILPYLRRLTALPDDKLLNLMGWMVAINPIGQFVFAPLLGWLGNKLQSIRLICIVTCVLYIGGNVLYSSLSLFSNDPTEEESKRGVLRYSMMLLARLLVGISSANISVIRSYIAGATWKHERNKHISILSLFQALGFIVGPAIQSALTPVGCAQDYPNGELKFDMYTIAGWLSAAVGFVSLILFLPCFFTEHNVAKLEAERLRGHGEGNTVELGRPNLLAVVSCTVSFFFFLFNFILLETIGTPLCMEQLGWDEQKSIQNLGILMSIGAGVSMVAYASVAPLTKRIDERKVFIIFGLIPMVIGRIVMIPMWWYDQYPKQKTSTSEFVSMLLHLGLRGFKETDGNSCSQEGGEGGCDYDELPWCGEIPVITEAQFYLGYAISAVSFPYCTAICQAVFSKVIGPRPQGLWMALITSVGSLARICGPIFVSLVYVNLGTYWTFGICAASLVASLVITLISYKTLVPIEDLNQAPNQENKDPDTQTIVEYQVSENEIYVEKL